MKPITLEINNLEDNGFNCYLKGRSFDLEENNQEYSPEKAVFYYKKGYYEFNNILCQYSIAISVYLNDFEDLFDDNDKSVPFPDIKDLIELSKKDNLEAIYAKFVLAAYYNYGLKDTKKDENKAFEIIRECAEKGHVGAMYDLGAKEKFLKKLGNNDIDYLSIAAQNGSVRAKKLIKNRNK